MNQAVNLQERGRSIPRGAGFLAPLAGAGFLIWACGDGGAPSTPAPPAASPAPPAAPPSLAWPVGGEEGLDWVINSYVDLDPGPGRRDYRGGDRTYNGHDGTDIYSPNFRWMDRDLPPVLAAAPGRVTDLRDGEFDRHSAIADARWNFVEITHADGSRAIYGHLKKRSVSVSLGQSVDSGEQLGVVGSSGRSTRPHLHFEFRSRDNRVLAPFLQEMWADPPAYDPPLSVMDYHVQRGFITLRQDKGLREFTDPPPNIDSIAVGEAMAIGLSLAGGRPGDSIRITLRDGFGSLRGDSIVDSGSARHRFGWWNTTALGHPGTWEITVEENGETVRTHPLRVLPAR
ncbi:MAG: M23 family metallopeptidase [Acidobacteria bacterium]|nr:M23 family metallopeptidase [Acidobacteriota bacterium]MYG74950.1 M23 family metallopeptidase [Acidobacteriota bacterium]